jgi:hypothetical protein
MAILLDHGLYVLSANATAPTHYLPLPPGKSRVDVVYGTGVTGTVTPKTSINPGIVAANAPLELNGEELVLYSSYSFEVTGPGFIGFIVASLAGGTIQVRVTR